VYRSTRRQNPARRSASMSARAADLSIKTATSVSVALKPLSCFSCETTRVRTSNRSELRLSASRPSVSILNSRSAVCHCFLAIGLPRFTLTNSFSFFASKLNRVVFTTLRPSIVKSDVTGPI